MSINQGVFLPYNFWSIYEEICHCVLLKEASFIAAKLYSVFIPGRVLYLSVRIFVYFRIFWAAVLSMLYVLAIVYIQNHAADLGLVFQ